MSVIVEFSIAGEDFQLGQILRNPPEMHLELEQIVPTSNQVMPFLWATGENHEIFEENIRTNPAVRELLKFDVVDDSVLYRIEWETKPRDLIEGLTKSDAVILEAHGNGIWNFRLRFPDHEQLSEFHNYIIESEIPINIDRTYTLIEETERGLRFELTQEQREALVLALDRGYFETPSEVSLDELADELGITRQALSDRIRRGNKKILGKSLGSSG